MPSTLNATPPPFPPNVSSAKRATNLTLSAHVLDEAKRNGARLPVTALVDQFYADVQKMGGRRWDTSSLIQRLK